MLCYSCQARNNDDNLFCTTCGVRLAPPSPEQARENAGGMARPGQAGSPDARGIARMDATRRIGPEEFSPRSNESWPAPVPFPSHRSAVNPWPRMNGRALTPYEPPLPSYAGARYAPAPTLVCAQCGFPRASVIETCPRCGRMVANNSGQNASIPAELDTGWNWGAFLCPVLWSVAHETWFGLLGLLPGLNLVVAFVLGARGNELAWQNRRFHSLAHFQEVQRLWRNGALGVSAIVAAFFVILLFGLIGS